MKQRACIALVIFGCGGAETTPDAFVTLQYVGIQGNTSAVHATTMPAGIDCGPTTTECSHSFVSRSLVHLHIEQVVAVPYDLDFRATDMLVTVSCAP